MNIIDFIVSNFNEFLSFTGFANATVGNIIMIVVGIFFIWLAIKKDFEPLLLVPIGLGIVLGNIPFRADAGLEIIEARITYLAYAPEIAAVMLQRQQASAIVDARKMIVDGAVGMVEMALERLSEKQVIELDEERKAAMVSNLLVVLCGNKDAQPVVNSGSLY